MKNVIPVLAAALIATTGASSAAHAALVDFGVAAIGGTITFSGGSTLDTSSSLDLDGAILGVSSIGPGDESGLVTFGSGPNDTVSLTEPIAYGAGSGPVSDPISAVKSWTGIIGGKSDTFTETLTKVTDIDRATMNAITVTLTGTLTDSLGLFTNAKAELILGASQVEGGGSAISASMTNTAVSSIPEPSTWVMMALGFVGLGYAAVRRGSRDRSVLAV
jgi:PEP-CTERM motif-containing protein